MDRYLKSQMFDEINDLLSGCHKLFLGKGAGDADISLTGFVEGVSGNDGDMLFLQQLIGKFFGAEACLLDVHEQIEGGGRSREMKLGRLLEFGGHGGASAAENLTDILAILK